MSERSIDSSLIKKRFMTSSIRLLLIAAATLAIGSATAHNHNPEKRADHHEMMIEHKTDQMAKSLALNDVQRRAIHDLNRQRAEAFHAARHDSSLPIDQRQARFDEADSVYRTKLKSVLTPQQYDQWLADYNSAVMPRGKCARHDLRYKHSAEACCKGQCSTKTSTKQ
jgi:Spy/CpxP family protein refolding chaperone